MDVQSDIVEFGGDICGKVYVDQIVFIDKEHEE